jgi:hypothetical protein
VTVICLASRRPRIATRLDAARSVINSPSWTPETLDAAARTLIAETDDEAERREAWAWLDALQEAD